MENSFHIPLDDLYHDFVTILKVMLSTMAGIFQYSGIVGHGFFYFRTVALFDLSDYINPTV